MLPFLSLVRNSYIRRPLLLAATVAALILAAVLLTSLAGDAVYRAAAADNAGFTPLAEIPANAQQVTVGVFPISVYNIDFSGNTYFLEAYVWFRWQGEIDPTQSVEFVNAVDQWGLLISPFYEEPIQLSDGSLYQGMRISGRFSQPFSLERFPLDEQKLSILIEDTDYSSQELVYIADTADSGYGDLLKVPGWNIIGWNVESLLHRYASAFGDTDTAGSTDQYAALRYQLVIGRSIGYFLWKLLLPLLIVMIITLSTLLIHPNRADMRVAMPTTALLTAVFLQQTYTSALPETGNLVLMDRLYVLAYLVIVSTMIGALWAVHRMESNSVNVAAIQFVDRVQLAVILVVMTFATAAIILVS